MSDVQLGTSPGVADFGKRDAIHVAVVAMRAADTLEPGQGVMLGTDGWAVVADIDEAVIGVVDPFLDREVHYGTRFWLIMNPGSVTGLRHEWSHPAFPELSDSGPAYDGDGDGCSGC